MNLIRYILDFFHINGAGQQAIKYAKDQLYPATEETLSHVVAGIAEVVSDAALAVKDFVEGKQEANETALPMATPEPSAPVATPQPETELVAAQPDTNIPVVNTTITPPAESAPVVKPAPAPLPEPVPVLSTTVVPNTSVAEATSAPVSQPSAITAATASPKNADPFASLASTPADTAQGTTSAGFAAPATQVPVSATAGNDPSVVVPPPVTTVVAPELGTPMASAEPAAQPAPAANS